MALLFLASAFVLSALASVVLTPDKPSPDKSSEEKGNAHAGGLPDFLRYRVSLITDEDNPLLVLMLKKQLQDFAFIDEVYLEDEMTAEKRLAEGETLMLMKLPRGFLSKVGTSMTDEAVSVRLSEEMPEESLRLRPLLLNTARMLSHLQAAALSWQELYTQYTGDEKNSWPKLTELVFRELNLFSMRHGNIRSEEMNPYIGPVYYLASLLLLLCLIPGMLLLDIRGRMIHSSVGLRQQHVGAAVPALFSHSVLALLYAFFLLLPFAWLCLRFDGRAQLMTLALLTFCMLLTSFLYAAAAALLPLRPSSRAAFSWLGLLLLLFFSGALYPLELFPKGLARLFSLSPLAPAMENSLLFFSGLIYQQSVSLNWLSLISPALLPLAILIWGEKKRRQA